MKQILFDLKPAAIKKARLDAGYKTTRDAAPHVGLSHVMLSQMESGKKFGTVETLSKICRAYGIKLIIDENTAEAWG